MKTSKHGVEFIASFEGFVAHAYNDSGGVLTIGYGHTGPGTGAMGTITHARGLELLAGDVRTAEAAVNALHLQLTQGQFDALVSIAFNCGGGILGPGTSLGKALRQPGMPGVTGAMRLYTHDAAGHKLAGLVRRRDAEAELWGHPEAAGPAAWLTPKELRAVRELDELRKADHPSADQAQRIAALRTALTVQRKRIWRAAQDGRGWDYGHRRQRYRSLLVRTA